MMKNFWELVVGIAALTAIALSLFFFLHAERAKKRDLEVTFISATNLINEEFGNANPSLKLSYDGTKIRNYSIFQFKIENTGRQPILPEDFTQPLQIHFKDVQKITSSEKLNSDPNDLPVTFTISNSSLTISPLLLNPTDWFLFKVGVIPSAVSIPTVSHISTRISDIKRITYKSSLGSSLLPFRSFYYRISLVGALIGVIAALLVFVLGLLLYIRSVFR